MRQRAKQGDDAWVVSQAVDCDTASHACARQHLIKGQACLKLAQRGDAPRIRFACAADALAKGILLETSWEKKGEQIKIHEQLCQALDGLLQAQSKAATDESRERLLEAAQSLYQLTPDSIPAKYYIFLARLRQLEPGIPFIDAASRLPVCIRLKRTVNQVLMVMETAKHEPPPEWGRFESSYQRLAFELGVAMRDAGCR